MAKNLNKVLIVDDEEDLIEVLSSALMMKGLDVVVAKDGVEALKKWEEHSDIDLLISDIRMPGLNCDGITLTKRVREKSSSIPIILITGYSEFSESFAQKMGANQVVSKPFEFYEILCLVDKYLNN